VLTLWWSDAAQDDLHRIRAGLDAKAAARVGRIIAEAADALAEFPERGRPGTAPGTRELPLPGLPWRLVHRATEDQIRVLRLLG
jgi:toxin ParE1/3/4